MDNPEPDAVAAATATERGAEYPPILPSHSRSFQHAVSASSFAEESFFRGNTACSPLQLPIPAVSSAATAAVFVASELIGDFEDSTTSAEAFTAMPKSTVATSRSAHVHRHHPDSLCSCPSSVSSAASSHQSVLLDSGTQWLRNVVDSIGIPGGSKYSTTEGLTNDSDPSLQGENSIVVLDSKTPTLSNNEDFSFDSCNSRDAINVNDDAESVLDCLAESLKQADSLEGAALSPTGSDQIAKQPAQVPRIIDCTDRTLNNSQISLDGKNSNSCVLLIGRPEVKMKIPPLPYVDLEAWFNEIEKLPPPPPCMCADNLSDFDMRVLARYPPPPEFWIGREMLRESIVNFSITDGCECNLESQLDAVEEHVLEEEEEEFFRLRAYYEAKRRVGNEYVLRPYEPKSVSAYCSIIEKKSRGECIGFFGRHRGTEGWHPKTQQLRRGAEAAAAALRGDEDCESGDTDGATPVNKRMMVMGFDISDDKLYSEGLSDEAWTKYLRNYLRPFHEALARKRRAEDMERFRIEQERRKNEELRKRRQEAFYNRLKGNPLYFNVPDPNDKYPWPFGELASSESASVNNAKHVRFSENVDVQVLEHDQRSTTSSNQVDQLRYSPEEPGRSTATPRVAAINPDYGTISRETSERSSPTDTANGIATNIHTSFLNDTLDSFKKVCWSVMTCFGTFSCVQLPPWDTCDRATTVTTPLLTTQMHFGNHELVRPPLGGIFEWSDDESEDEQAGSNSKWSDDEADGR
ncbi:hypothetical protein HDU82_004817 [Entophlyctis luteolus]|nr:hypothetical protein HDU82_004817 [Entophlyctis luteolus]